MTKWMFGALVAICLCADTLQARADVIASSSDGFHIKLERETDQSQTRVAERIFQLSDWWSSDHTYSGNAENLILTSTQVGGRWMEVWPDGSVLHGTLIGNMTLGKNQIVRFDAALGPLQQLGVSAVLNITLSPSEGSDGTQITFDYRVTGADHQSLDKWAEIVEGVLAEQIENLSTPQ